jgi:hypothetical protein
MTQAMQAATMPRYPVYVPSKARYDVRFTAKCLTECGVPFYLVVEPQEEAHYREHFPKAAILTLPWTGDDARRRAYCAERGIENGGLIAARNWIMEHAIAGGAERHWQLDDNIRDFWRRYQGKRLRCDAGPALRVCEDFTDRYENVAISGLNYYMFAPDDRKIRPFQANCHVYSCSLINNAIPFRWRLAYNDDTDICLQALAAGWNTLLLNTFLCWKLRTMTVKGGNTHALYQGDGRLKMARSLERMWPGVVTTDRRFNRPQHVVADSWKRFDTPLKLKPGLTHEMLAQQQQEYGLQLRQVRPDVKSERIKGLLADWRQDHGG